MGIQQSSLMPAPARTRTRSRYCRYRRAWGRSRDMALLTAPELVRVRDVVTTLVRRHAVPLLARCVEH